MDRSFLIGCDDFRRLETEGRRVDHVDAVFLGKKGRRSLIANHCLIPRVCSQWSIPTTSSCFAGRRRRATIPNHHGRYRVRDADIAPELSLPTSRQSIVCGMPVRVPTPMRFSSTASFTVFPHCKLSETGILGVRKSKERCSIWHKYRPTQAELLI
jgi:hypothetical protein